AGRSAIWSETGDMLIQLEANGSGVAVVTETHEDGFFALRVSVAGGREANPLHDEAALLKYPKRSPVAGSGGGDQRTFGDFLQQQAERLGEADRFHFGND